MRALIFNTEQESKDWDVANNKLKCNVTKYLFARKLIVNERWALMVGDALDTVEYINDEVVVTPHPDVVTLTADDFPEQSMEY